MSDYNFAYLDEPTKRMIRRAILKGLAIPGYQVPFASREMPMPYGWGTGGVQVTAATLTPDDTLKVIDQGADDTTNAVSIRRFFQRVAGVATTERTAEAKSQLVEFERTGFAEGPVRTVVAGMEGGSDIGSYEFTVRFHGDGFVVRVIQGDAGVLFTTDDMDVAAFEDAASAIRRLLTG